ncbi:PspA/IM30 family protein [Phreatobacter sp. AB_2022a]|uniref:PspA/IM30 family protein n=1 Tax=Phreatobacter sp. AB_2022a TaxID=3003134 RepID=UPI002286E555|nr:PspA/IM30 family protein [Phreatobacter sp. AB_2022a]MCZ0735007.1 PspA/IM30 family protein [Phreatobacter sp. AB_2022a]
MFKTIITLLRGHVGQAGETIAERNALVILDQQMRDAAGAFGRAKKALSLAIAQDGQETARIATTSGRIADLEQRVGAAIAAGDEEAAREGAEVIATLEADRAAATAAQALFAADILRLRRHVTQAQARIADLERGRRLARAGEAVRDLRRVALDSARPGEASLADAERTLERLRERQNEAEAAAAALDELDGAAIGTVTEKLAAKGYGARLRPTADDVLLRLRQGNAQPAQRAFPS